MNELRKVSSNPHIRMHISTQMIMLCVHCAFTDHDLRYLEFRTACTCADLSNDRIDCAW
mgnify:CR=1 FL=1